MFAFFRNIFKREKAVPSSIPMPAWEDVVAIMYDKKLEAFCGDVVEVIYSRDKAMRYVIVKEENGLFGYCLEIIYQFDNEEWKYISSRDKSALPAMWVPHPEAKQRSVFDTRENALVEIYSEPTYKEYFINQSENV